jgi:ribosomal silencing factor RsfS
MLSPMMLWCIMKNKEVREVFIVSIEEKLIQDFLALPDDKKLEVIDFVEFLKNRSNKQMESLMDEIIIENREALRELAK